MFRTKYVFLFVLLGLSFAHTSGHAATVQSTEQQIIPPQSIAHDRVGFSTALYGNNGVFGATRGAVSGPLTRFGTAHIFDPSNGTIKHKLVAPDGALDDQFGFSVDTNAAYTAVGAIRADSGNTTDTGAVYIFDTQTGAFDRKLVDAAGQSGDQFGRSLSINGDKVLIGSVTGANSNNVRSGTAFIFDLHTGAQLHKLESNDGVASDFFGRSVSATSQFATIGAAGDDDNGPNSGSAYIFDMETGAQLRKLVPTDNASGDQFGFSAASFRNTSIIGAINDDDLGTDSGSAYIFDTATGLQLAKLTAPDGAAGDRFGHSVDLFGSLAIVGANFDDTVSATNGGSAYLFDIAGALDNDPNTDVEFIEKLVAGTGVRANMSYGYSVAANSQHALVGAIFAYDPANAITGAAYSYSTASLQISNVPLPASGWLMLSALAAGGVLRLKQKKQNAQAV